MFSNLRWIYVHPLAARRPTPTSAQAAAPDPAASSVAQPTRPQRPSATGITVELLKTRGLAGLYKGAGATLMRLTYYASIPTRKNDFIKSMQGCVSKLEPITNPS